jgi:hypothetical protein
MSGGLPVPLSVTKNKLLKTIRVKNKGEPFECSPFFIIFPASKTDNQSYFC